MAKYVIDCCSLNIFLKNYYIEIFGKVWDFFEAQVRNGNLISNEEIRKELDVYFKDNSDYQQNYNRIKIFSKELFLELSQDEMKNLTVLMKDDYVKKLVKKSLLAQNKPNADPTIIAQAITREIIVISEEDAKKSDIKIPHICKKYGVECIKLREFLIREGLDLG